MSPEPWRLRALWEQDWLPNPGPWGEISESVSAEASPLFAAFHHVGTATDVFG